MKNLLKNLWSNIPSRRKKQYYLLVVLMIIASLLEVVSLGMVMPFLGILIEPGQIYNNSFAQPIIHFFDITSPEQLINLVTIAFIFTILMSSAVRLLLLYASTRLSFTTGSELSVRIYNLTLHQEYMTHLMRNSSEIIAGISSKTGATIMGVLLPVLILISSLFIVSGIIIALLLISAKVAITSALFIFSIYFFITRYTRKSLKRNSMCIAKESSMVVKALQEGLGGIRDVLIDGKQEFYSKLYRNSDLPLRRATGSNIFIAQSPKHIIEPLGMIFIVIFAYVMIKRNVDSTSIIPLLGAFALGAQRLLPALQQAYSAYSTINGHKESLKDVVELLSQPPTYHLEKVNQSHIHFKEFIELKKVSFRYNQHSDWILKNINLKIEKGKTVGFIGETGSGKSTLIDIVMGLILQTDGNLYVDDQLINKNNIRSWQNNIAHVPQSIFLIDETIEQNIAFGEPLNKINHERVQIAAKQAQLDELIESWEKGYETVIGERGVRLSGGQRQRIGIARALYKKSKVIIFDEATSALDNETESDVMKSIGELSDNLTVLLIAHRLSTLKNCDFVVQLTKDKEIVISNYQDIV